MYLYLIIILFGFLSLKELLVNKFNLELLLFSLSIPFFMSFFRWERGTDWNTYFLFFNDLSLAKSNDTEPGLIFLTNLVHLLGGSYTWLLFLQAIIIYSFIFLFIRKSPYPVFSILIWMSISFAGMFFVRQTVALSIVLFSFKYLIERNFFKYLLFVFLAFLFHRSALIVLPFYLMVNIRLNRFYIVFLLCFCALVSKYIADLLGSLPFMSNTISMRLGGYLESGDNNFGSKFTPYQTMLRGVSFRVFYLVILIGVFYKQIMADDIKRVLFYLYYYGVLLFILLVPVSTVLIRFSIYFDTVQILLIPMLFKDIKGYMLRALCFLMFFGLLMFRFYGVVEGYKDEYVPFKTIFQK